MENKLPIYIETLSSNSQTAFTLQDSKLLGEKKQGKIIYSPYETLYLIELKKAKAIKNNKQIKDDEVIKIFSKKYKDFSINYVVFMDLRKKGYIVKSGLKFGSEFRVYESKKDAHATWIVFPVAQSRKINWEDFIAKNRIAHSTGKKLLIAIVDQQEDIAYYEVSWMKI
jgi:tRNA-intron endonuclease